MGQKSISTRTRKTSRKTRRDEPEAPDFLSASALKLIDQAMALLKEGVLAGAKQGNKGRQTIKKKAVSLVNTTAQHLTKALNEGSRAISKNIQKL